MNKLVCKIFIVLILSINFSWGRAQGEAAAVNALIGAGVNGYKIFVDHALAWPSYYFTELKDSGFSSVRIVYENNLYSTISGADLIMIQEAVDECISAGLIPVIDYHYTQWDTYTTEKGALFVYNWGAISSHFKTYTYDQVVFELSNEPFTLPPANVSAETWNTLASNLVTAIRGYDADRVIMVSPLQWAHIDGLRTFTLPDYDNLILSIHYYKPDWVVFQNCEYDGVMNGESYAGTHWRNVQTMVDNLEEEWQPVFDFQSANSNIPVNIGEFGTTIWCDSINRVKYYTLLTRFWDSKGFSYINWDYDFDFGIMQNPALGEETTRQFYPGLVDAIISDPLLLDTYDSTTIFYETTFSSTTGWRTYQTGGGAVNITAPGDGMLHMNVTASDYMSLNARVYTPYFNLYKDSVYRITYTFRAASGVKGEIVHKFAGEGHSGYNTYDLGTSSVTRCQTYIMPIATQMSTYLEFWVGYGLEDVYLEELRIEKLTVIPYVPAPEVDVDTLFFEEYDDANNVDVVYNADCADSTVMRSITSTETVIDTIGLINFNYGGEAAAGWISLPYYPPTDSVQLDDGSWFISTPNLAGGSAGVYPGYFNTYNVDRYYHYLPNSSTSPVVYYIHNADTAADYEIQYYASRAATGSLLNYMTIGSETVSVNPYNNSTTLLSIDSISPAADSSITISFDRTDGFYGYINALIIIKTKSVASNFSASWTSFSGVDFGTEIDSVRYAVDFNQSVGVKSFEMRLDSLDGLLVDSFSVDEAGCAIRAQDITAITGIHDVYFLLDTLDAYHWITFYDDTTDIVYHNITDTFFIKSADYFSDALLSYNAICLDTTAHISDYVHFYNVYLNTSVNAVDIKMNYFSNGTSNIIYLYDEQDVFAPFVSDDYATDCGIITLRFDELDWSAWNNIKAIVLFGNATFPPDVEWMRFYYITKHEYSIYKNGIRYSITGKSTYE
jgi:hypothetical protein